MGIVNKRNALLGWGVWKLGKRLAKRKAKDALPPAGETSWALKGKIGAAAGAIGALLFFWCRKRSARASGG